MNNSSPRARILRAAFAGVVGGALLLAEPASAHTGLTVGGGLDGAAHPVLGIDHLLAMVAVGVLAATARDRRVAWLTPVGFVAGMIGGGLLGLMAVDIPLVELVIAMSVVVLGILIVTATRKSGAKQRALWLPVLAAAFGAAHGHAHGAELPTGAVPIAYVAGFVLATAALHLAGTGFGLSLRRAPAVRITAGALVSAAGVTLLLAG